MLSEFIMAEAATIVAAIFLTGIALGELAIWFSKRNVSAGMRLLVDVTFGIFGWIIIAFGLISFPSIWFLRKFRQNMQ